MGLEAGMGRALEDKLATPLPQPTFMHMHTNESNMDGGGGFSI